MTNNSEVDQDPMERIKQRFLKDACDKIENMNGALSQLKANQDTQANIQMMVREAHNLKGSGATFGYEGLSKYALLLEFYLKAIEEGEAVINQAQYERIASLIDLLQKELSGKHQSPMPMASKNTEVQASGNLFFLDENPKRGEELAHQLALYGMSVIQFNRIDDLVNQYQQEHPAALILRLNNPIGVSQYIPKELFRHSFTIVLSHKSDFENRLAAARLGCSHYLLDPIEPRHIVDAIEQNQKLDRPYRILLVDDEITQAEHHSLLLEEAGMLTATIQDPAQTLKAVASFQPDLIIMDLYMPDCNGHEVATILKQHESYSMIPIIYLSSEERFDKQVEALHAWGEDFLSKPVEPARLIAITKLRVKRSYRLKQLMIEHASLLQELESKHNVIEQNHMVMMTDTNGSITYINNNFSQNTGFALMDLLGLNLKNDGNHYPETLWQTVANGKPWQGELELRHKNGSNIVLETTVTPLLDDKNHLRQLYWTATNTTAYTKKTQELQEALAEAEASMKAKSDYLAYSSHEMRTALNGIMGMANFLGDTPLTPDQKKMTLNISDTVGHLVELMNKTLDFAKIEAGKLELETVPFNLRNCVEEVGELFAPRAHEKNLDLIVHYDHDVPQEVVGDPIRLRQVLINLVNNAIKFTDKGSITLSLTRKKVMGEIASIHFSVSDTGIGISEEHQRKIFELYQQAEQNTTRKYGGTGLGLAIANRLVEAMGGALTVDSMLDMGSTFQFDSQFPIHPVKDIPQNMDHLNILVICDVPQISHAIGELLKAIGCNYDLMSNPLQVIANTANAINSNKFNVILLRQKEPNACLEFKKAFPATHSGKIPIILLNRYTELEQTRNLLNEGFRSSLLLPPRQMSLLNELRQFNLIKQQGQPISGLEHQMRELRRQRTAHKILVSDDNPFNQRITARILTQSGYVCILAENGKKTIEMLAQHKISVLLLDCFMPVMDGFEAAKAIRQDPQFIDLPIIGLTAADDDHLHKRCLEAGMDHVLVKPILPKQLYDILDELLISKPTKVYEIEQPKAADLPVDLNFLKTAIDGNLEVEEHLIRLFQVSVEREIDVLASCLRTGDLMPSLHAAHKIKGASRQIGAMSMERIAAHLEHLCLNDTMDSARSIFASLKGEFTRVCLYLDDYILKGFIIH